MSLFCNSEKLKKSKWKKLQNTFEIFNVKTHFDDEFRAMLLSDSVDRVKWNVYLKP